MLDIGCGHAEFLSDVYAGRPGVVGLDPDVDALQRNRLIPLRVAALGEDLPFADATFDLVVAAWVLEHLTEPARMAGEVARVLRPRGRFVFLTPNVWNYNVWMIRLVPNRLHDVLTRRLYGRQERDTFPVRYRANSPRRLDSVLGGAGLRRVELKLNGDPSYIAFNRPLFEAAVAVEQLLDLGALRSARVHIVGVYEK